MNFIEDFLRRLVLRWPAEMQQAFRRYMGRWPEQKTGVRKYPQLPFCDPYWLLIPAWLSGTINSGKGQSRIGRTVLNDILWGQYCLFLSVRIQDDLFDRHVRSRALIYAADQFFLEAGRIFERHFRNRPLFWKYYYGYLEETTLAIVAADGLQKSRLNKPALLLNEYARVSSLFKIGMAAVCLLGKRERQLTALTEAADFLAKAAQIADDVEDSLDDLRSGRLNYAVQILLREVKVIPRRQADLEKLIAGKMIYSKGINRLFGEIAKNLKLAESHLTQLNHCDSAKYFEKTYATLARGRDKFHAERVKIIFGHG
jgi:hypothetical protein